MKNDLNTDLNILQNLTLESHTILSLLFLLEKLDAVCSHSGPHQKCSVTILYAHGKLDLKFV